MRKIFILLFLSFQVVGQNSVFKANPKAVIEKPHETLKIGAKAPDFTLPATDGKFYSLGNFASSKVLVIIFTCVHCPTAQAYEDRMIKFTNDYKTKGVQVIAISPNSPTGLMYEELGYTDLGDGFEDMKIRFKDKGYNFPFLYDGDNEVVSMKYGPVATPHVYVFGKDRTLKYTGRLDGVEKPGNANAEDLRDATDAILAGKDPNPATSKVFGCSTKWGWKNEYKAKVQAEWDTKPVSIEELDENGIKSVLKNDSKKLYLVNIWATWCGPCVVEYPEFITIQRMYGQRDFEFISISADKIAQKEKVLNFLKNKHSAVKNYIFNGKDSYKLIEAVDPKWDGALPYTLLIEPGGKIVYSIQGGIKPLVLKKKIVEHPMIGRYF